MTTDFSPFSGQQPSLSLIVAYGHQRVIGHHNQLPWRLPEDLQFFKRTTLGHPIIMGRNTFESIGRPLPGRRNLVVSRQQHYQSTGIEVAPSLSAAIQLCQEQPSQQEIFVIGGAQLYAAALPFATRLYATEIHADFAGDAWFPDFSGSGLIESSRETHHAAAPNHFMFDFVLYERKSVVA